MSSFGTKPIERIMSESEGGEHTLGYPVLPGPGVLIVLLGVPVYYVWRDILSRDLSLDGHGAV